MANDNDVEDWEDTPTDPVEASLARLENTQGWLGEAMMFEGRWKLVAFFFSVSIWVLAVWALEAIVKMLGW